MNETVYPLREVRCRENETYVEVVTENSSYGFTKSTTGFRGTNVSGPRDISGLYDEDQLLILEINPQTKTLDLVLFTPTATAPLIIPIISRFTLCALTREQITDEFLDALFCANQRIRSWL